MFVYRHFHKWGFGIGLLPFLLVVLPLMLLWAVAKAALLAIGEVAIVSWRVIAWAWRRAHTPASAPDDPPARE